MLFLTLSICVMFALLDRSLRTGRIDLLKLKLRFDLFRLRDELRAAAIAGEAPMNQWFEYLDTTITKSIDKIASLNVWEIFGLLVAHRGDADILKAYDHLMEQLQRSENRKLAEVYKKLLILHGSFLAKRNRAVCGAIAGAARIGGRATNATADGCPAEDRAQRLPIAAFAYQGKPASGVEERIQRVLISAPETSTLLKYCV